jgi:hypothetical protein
MGDPILTRTGLILEPSKAGGKTSLAVMRADNGILFRMVETSHEPVPLGDCVIAWKDLDMLIQKLCEFSDANLPRHHYFDIDIGKMGSRM